MNRNQTPIHQENYQFYAYGPHQPIIPQGYIQNGSFYPVIQQVIMPIFPIQQGNNPANKHQPQIITQQQLHPQQQPNSILLPKKTTYPNLIQPKPIYRQWTPEEDQQIINMVKMNGTAWDGIAATLHDRTGTEVSNRYHELKNRMALPIPSIQPRAMGAFYEDIDNNNENKEENSFCFFKHVSYGTPNNNVNFNNINRNTYSSPNHNFDNFELINSDFDNNDTGNNQNNCVLQFSLPDNEFNLADA